MTIPAAKRDLCTLLSLAYPHGIAVQIVMRAQERHGHSQMETLSSAAQLIEDDELTVIIGPIVKWAASGALIARLDAEVAAAVEEMSGRMQA